MQYEPSTLEQYSRHPSSGEVTPNFLNSSFVTTVSYNTLSADSKIQRELVDAAQGAGGRASVQLAALVTDKDILITAGQRDIALTTGEVEGQLSGEGVSYVSQNDLTIKVYSDI